MLVCAARCWAPAGALETRSWVTTSAPWHAGLRPRAAGILLLVAAQQRGSEDGNRRACGGTVRNRSPRIVVDIAIGRLDRFIGRAANARAGICQLQLRNVHRTNDTLTYRFSGRPTFFAECLQQFFGLRDDAIQVAHYGFKIATAVFETLRLCGHWISSFSLRVMYPATLRRAHGHTCQSTQHTRPSRDTEHCGSAPTALLSAFGVKCRNSRRTVGRV